MAISTVVIPTRDRQDQAVRALASFQLEAVRVQRTLKFIVLDDTVERAEYADCRVIRPADVQALVEKLVLEGFEREVVEFGLTGPYGGTRNVALLATLG